MQICKVCGKAMDDHYSVCPYCGASAAANTETEPGEKQNGGYPPPYTPPYAGNQQSYSQPGENGNYYSSVPNQNMSYTPAPRPQRSAYIAALLAFFGGMWGLHNFYLDNKNRAILQLVLSVVGLFLTFGIVTVAIEVWAVVEGIQLLRGDINTDGTGAFIKMSF